MKPDFVIGDTHIPYTRGGYLEHCIKVRKEHGCGRVIHIGDLCDQHTVSPSFNRHPASRGTIEELALAKKTIREWGKAFPEMVVIVGNHDRRIARSAASVGIPEEFLRPLREIYEAPRGWEFKLRHQERGVLYVHGDPRGGKYIHRNLAEMNRQSVVCGHVHHVAGVELMASYRDLIFGCAVGCGVDDAAYAMEYAANHPQKSVISCAVVFGPASAGVFPMDLGTRR